MLERMMRYYERISLWRAKRLNPRKDLLAGLSDPEICQEIPHKCADCSLCLRAPESIPYTSNSQVRRIVALRFYASGAFLTLITDCTRVSRAAACRSVREASEALCERLRQFVKWPTGAEAESMKEKFYGLAGDIIIL